MNFLKTFLAAITILSAFALGAQPPAGAQWDTTQCTQNNGLPNFCYQAGYEAGLEDAGCLSPGSVTYYLNTISLLDNALTIMVARVDSLESLLNGCPTDLDGNGSTGSSDLLELLIQFNESCE
jgi:hypothetical protein